MKNLIVKFALAFGFLFSISSSASTLDDGFLLKKLKSLDIDNTCKTDLQNSMGVQTLKWFALYAQEDLDEQMKLFSDDMKLYHSALLRFVVMNPEVAPYLKWGTGPITKTNYRATLAQLIQGEDQSQPGDQPLKIRCGTNNSVVVNVKFTGYKTSREPIKGCITHRARYSGLTTKTFVFDPETLKVNIMYFDFDGNLADLARLRLAAMSKENEIPVNPKTCRTAAETKIKYGVDP